MSPWETEGRHHGTKSLQVCIRLPCRDSVWSPFPAAKHPLCGGEEGPHFSPSFQGMEDMRSESTAIMSPCRAIRVSCGTPWPPWVILIMHLPLLFSAEPELPHHLNALPAPEQAAFIPACCPPAYFLPQPHLLCPVGRETVPRGRTGRTLSVGLHRMAWASSSLYAHRPPPVERPRPQLVHHPPLQGRKGVVCGGPAGGPRPNAQLPRPSETVRRRLPLSSTALPGVGGGCCRQGAGPPEWVLLCVIPAPLGGARTGGDHAGALQRGRGRAAAAAGGTI